MSRYFLEFSKKGEIKYISHLDMQRLFKRAFKSSGIPIEYSKGYNPHPKMGFAQPLSLGYTSSQDYLEFNTIDSIDLSSAKEKLRNAMPKGIEIIDVKELEIEPKSLASIVVSSVYYVEIPIDYRSRKDDLAAIVKNYLSQETIIAKKRDKKTKSLVDKDIKNQIRRIELEESESNKIILVMELDSGSKSNLSPEQVIQSFTSFSELYLPREEIEVDRRYLIFESCIPKTIGLHLENE